MPHYSGLWIGFELMATQHRLDVMENYNVAIVAAMEREIAPLVKNWLAVTRQYADRSFKFFEKPPVVLVCGGIGSEASRRAAEAIINLYHPATIISAGFAGGLDAKLKIAEMLSPRHVIDAGDGSRTDSGVGEGVLISFESVADVDQKAKLLPREILGAPEAEPAHCLPWVFIGVGVASAAVVGDAQRDDVVPGEPARAQQFGYLETGGGTFTRMIGAEQA